MRITSFGAIITLMIPAAANAEQLFIGDSAAAPLELTVASNDLRKVDEFSSVPSDLDAVPPLVAPAATAVNAHPASTVLSEVPAVAPAATIGASAGAKDETTDDVTSDIADDTATADAETEDDDEKQRPDLFALNEPGAAKIGATKDASPEIVAEPHFWNAGILVGVVLFGIAGAGAFLVKLKRKGNLGFGKVERDMEVLSTLSISPKRQVMLIKIRDKEIAIACTEHGIQFLTAIEDERTYPRAAQEAPRARIEQSYEQPKPRVREAAQKSLETSRPAVAANDGQKHKSEIFMQALKSLKGKNPKIETRDTEGDSDQPLPSLKTPEKKSPTMGATRGSFPKYLANAFDKEQKRPLAQTQDSDEESVESVTNMIREKLKSINT